MKDLRRKIKERFELSDLSYIVDFDNLDSIIFTHKIYCRNEIERLKVDCTDISNQSVQNGRSHIVIPCTGKSLHDYVPLYWGRKRDIPKCCGFD